MRLSVSLLLVLLALCCYEGDATVCPALLAENTGYLYLPEDAFRAQLATFAPPEEAAEALITVKKCTDEMSFIERTRIAEALGEVVGECPVLAV
ncbi:secretoglobin family 1D member 2-like [Ochotona curzoniae]|uniref:secretoglobin family 1D member 2-like n=1 Tax=Ochotona curzoniae TaxID=130825 RepID=UPI001B3522ED|nr:secretoglobin family 1D member 2-like [Ochotona curzoniae]